MFRNKKKGKMNVREHVEFALFSINNKFIRQNNNMPILQVGLPRNVDGNNRVVDLENCPKIAQV